MSKKLVDDFGEQEQSPVEGFSLESSGYINATGADKIEKISNFIPLISSKGNGTEKSISYQVLLNGKMSIEERQINLATLGRCIEEQKFTQPYGPGRGTFHLTQVGSEYYVRYLRSNMKPRKNELPITVENKDDLIARMRTGRPLVDPVGSPAAAGQAHGLGQ